MINGDENTMRRSSYENQMVCIPWYQMNVRQEHLLLKILTNNAINQSQVIRKSLNNVEKGSGRLSLFNLIEDVENARDQLRWVSWPVKFQFTITSQPVTDHPSLSCPLANYLGTVYLLIVKGEPHAIHLICSTWWTILTMSHIAQT